MPRPIHKKSQEFLHALHSIEKQSESIVTIRTPKKGIFSFGRQKTVMSGVDAKKDIRAAKLALVLKICNTFIPYAAETKEQVKEAKEMLGRIGENLKKSESKVIAEQEKPSSKQKARIKFYEKLIKEGQLTNH
jgi:hypothetical protein